MPLIGFIRDYLEAAEEERERQKRTPKPMKYNPKRHR